jgi:hypothetical protein
MTGAYNEKGILEDDPHTFMREIRLMQEFEKKIKEKEKFIEQKKYWC